MISTKTGIDGDDKVMRKFLESQEKGFILDFSQNDHFKTLFERAKREEANFQNKSIFQQEKI